MELSIQLSQYKMQKVVTASKEVKLPTKPSFYFQTHIRRAIAIIPTYTTWKKEINGEPEEIWKYEIVCVYVDFKDTIEKFSIHLRDFERLYHLEKSPQGDFIRAWLDNEFLDRTKEQFESDFKSILDNIQQAFKY